MNATIAAIELHLAREAYAAAILASIEGTGSDAAVAMALEIVEARELAVERTMNYVPSYYSANGR